MKKIILFLCFVSFTGFAQELSEPSKFIKKASYVQINVNETEKAIFRSGVGEMCSFYPCEIIDLKGNIKLNGLQVESVYNIGSQGMTSINATEIAWIGMDEIEDLIIWFDNYVIPNLKVSVGDRKIVKYIFNTKEIMLKFEIYNNTQRFTVILNNAYNRDKYFWTETKVKDIPDVLATLKYLKNKVQ